jgi:hypothetical protein
MTGIRVERVFDAQLLRHDGESIVGKIRFLVESHYEVGISEGDDGCGVDCASRGLCR